ncbi:class I SAM-dependent methyltransferase [Brevibacterium senegalense]|uniref:class I SAM-dependent methyltransferase n=1 Tax=Brevibacterium senegalense TaxID=1033736 RepID=UPI0002F63483|nr:class I SAM-dependent methyltransferase [Brevibacterium senegalense]
MGTRFGAEAESYDRVRPRYPAGIYEWIKARVGGPGTAADVGAGTGIFGTGLTARGWTVTGIDPDPDLLWLHPDPALTGTAEDLPLADGSCDLVTVAQAWHWIEPAAASAEFLRVLGGDGAVAIVLNQLDVRVEWVLRLSRIMHAGDVYRPAWRPELTGFGPVETTTVPFETEVTVETVVDLARTRSYWLRSDAHIRARVERNIREFLGEEGRLLAAAAGDHCEQTGTFRLPYLCLGYLSRPSASGSPGSRSSRPGWPDQRPRR